MNTRKNNEIRPSKTEVLIDNYRESREEGIRLVNSLFTDIIFAVTFIGSIITGGVIANEPKLLLLIPFLLGGFGIYGIQKFRVNNLITSYMIYLEREINKEYPRPVMIWNSKLVQSNVSAGRKNKWGQAITGVIVVVLGIIFAGVCYWPCMQNQAFFSDNRNLFYIYITSCALVYIFNIACVISVLAMTRKYTPEYIKSLLESKNRYSKTPSKPEDRKVSSSA